MFRLHQQQQQRRFLSLLEYQGKQLLQARGINIQPFITLNELETTLAFTAPEFVIKAQVEAGGRAKGHFPQRPELSSGILFAPDLPSAKKLAQVMHQQTLITPQTGPQGALVKQVMIAQAVPDLLAQAYVAFILQQRGRRARASLLVSCRGGVDIEAVPPEEIHEFSLDETFSPSQIAPLLFPQFKDNQQLMDRVTDQLAKLEKCFFRDDLLQLEINPFSIIAGREKGCLDAICIDAKIQIDDNALFRQSQHFSFSQQDRAENYVHIEGGNLGCVVNGAGLAMATMDLIKLHGGSPANFLDLGGNATPLSIQKAINQAVAKTSYIKCLFINIFGGIVRCDDVAQGLIQAKSQPSSTISTLPLVVRLNGTNSKRAQEMLAAYSDIHCIGDFDQAARKAVEIATAENEHYDNLGGANYNNNNNNY